MFLLFPLPGLCKVVTVLKKQAPLKASVPSYFVWPMKGGDVFVGEISGALLSAVSSKLPLELDRNFRVFFRVGTDPKVVGSLDPAT